jgi:hypothetical protein
MQVTMRETGKWSVEMGADGKMSDVALSAAAAGGAVVG